MITLEQLSKQYGSKVLFEGASARISRGARIALIGPNGAGKTTLIRMLLNQESPDSGQIRWANHLRLGSLDQDAASQVEGTVLEAVLQLEKRKQEIRERTQTGGGQSRGITTRAEMGNDAELERYLALVEELEQLDEGALRARAEAILSGLGFKESDSERDLSTFSGGWRMRVALARLLLEEPDLLILDEPTNHLDLEALLWLEDFLQNYSGSLLIVSHDASFLNRVATEVWELDVRKLWSYRGNLTDYATQKELRLETLRAQADAQQERMDALESFIRRFGAKATKARQAQSRAKQLERLREESAATLDAAQTGSASVRFRFPPAPPSGREVVTLRDTGLSYGERAIFKDLNTVLMRGSRMGVVGVNGAGKSTLLRLLSGELTPSSGSLKLGHGVQVGYYSQLQAETLDLRNSILEELQSAAPDMPPTRLRSIAGAFLFSGDAVEKKCAVLSGGEKARVALAKLLLSPVNFLVMDEPTNHLDAASREVLLSALEDFEGTLVLVSHDREFIAPLVDTVLEIEPTALPADRGGMASRLIPWVGSYEDYLQKVTLRVRESAKRSNLKSEPRTSQHSGSRSGLEETQAAVEKSVSKGPSNNQIQSWRREKDGLEASIDELEKRRSELSLLLSDPALYQDARKAQGFSDEQRALEKKLETSMTRWEELGQWLEKL
jgi:ATP-binding cassette subfamily F protein 3